MNMTSSPRKRGSSIGLIPAFAGMTLLVAVSAFADSSQVRATARILVTKYTVGDNIRVLVETETPRDYTIQPPSEKTDFSPFELKTIEASPVARGKNRVRRTFVVDVTAFEKGTLQFPSVAVGWQSPDGRTGQVMTDPIEVEVTGVGRRPTDKDDIRGIKPPVSFGLRYFWTRLAAILAMLLSLALAVKIAVRRLASGPEDESRKPPHVRVRLELERLKDADLKNAAHGREYLAGTADILRRYVERRFGLDAMEKTTAELAASMREKNIDRAAAEKCRVFLERADLVKFAKDQPQRADLDTFERTLLEIVDETTPLEPEGNSR